MFCWIGILKTYEDKPRGQKGLTFKKLNAELFDEQFCIFFQSAFS